MLYNVLMVGLEAAELRMKDPPDKPDCTPAPVAIVGIGRLGFPSALL